MMFSMKLPRGRRAHEGARPAWRPRSAWLWMLAFRRHHEEIAIVLSGFDATERHITELYTTAVEQLGSDQASIRSSGLYALELLAQDNPAHRQATVNVICAYLRMPFSAAAPASMLESRAGEGRKEPGAESETVTSGMGETWRQERRVRLTAQHILAEHLRDDRAKDHQSTDPPSSRFWNNICLDLTGATLIDFSLVNGVMADADFHRAAFAGDALFSGAAFSGDARFGGAAFSGDALFDKTAFSGDASFREAAFRGDALFDEAAFGRGAGFRRAAFGRDAGFRKVTLAGDAWFDKAAFTGDAWFDKAAFSRGASFGEATFTGDAGFGEVTFGGDAGFDKAAFSRDAWFGDAAFTGHASFGEATFTGDAWFDKAAFSRGASFDEAAFTGDAGFGDASFGGGAWFGDASFSAGADALHFEQARIFSPGASHVWPTGWRLADADGGGFTVVRANDDGGSLATGQTCAAAQIALAFLWLSPRGALVLILIRADLAGRMCRGSRVRWTTGRRAYARRPPPCG
jgi:Pentapeptide repeats (9 copies)